MRGRFQGGSLAGFIIIGALLALVLIGGLYGLNRYNAQREADMAAQEDKQSGNETAKTDDTTGDTDRSSDQTSSSTGRSQTDTSARDQAATSSSQTTAATSANLPQTGPADTAFGLIAVVLLTFAATHYVRSRRITA